MIGYLLEQVLALLEPTGFAWGCLVIATAGFLWRKRWGSAAVTAIPMLVIFVFGATDIPGSLMRGLERPYAGMKIGELPPADAIAMLGGGAQPAYFEVADMHLTPAGDRIIMAMELARLRKAPTLVLGGNGADFPGRGTVLESETVRKWMQERNYVDIDVVALPRCSHTRDEATNVLKLARERGWRRVYLVTSANHMKRAVATFRTAGVDVVPVPCNFMTSLSHAPTTRPPGVPRAGGLAKMATWLHETIGWLEYRRRGWIDPSL